MTGQDRQNRRWHCVSLSGARRHYLVPGRMCNGGLERGSMGRGQIQLLNPPTSTPCDHPPDDLFVSRLLRFVPTWYSPTVMCTCSPATSGTNCVRRVGAISNPPGPRRISACLRSGADGECVGNTLLRYSTPCRVGILDFLFPIWLEMYQDVECLQLE